MRNRVKEIWYEVNPKRDCMCAKVTLHRKGVRFYGQITLSAEIEVAPAIFQVCLECCGRVPTTEREGWLDLNCPFCNLILLLRHCALYKLRHF